MKNRDEGIDIFKGFLVLGMVFAHVLQFFCKLQDNRVALSISNFVNIITFSGFVFAFGYVSHIAYYSKAFKDVYRRMLMTALKMLIAFYISGIYFRVLINHYPLNWEVIKNILLLNDIPGYSEFLISFALFIVIGVLLFKPIRKLVEYRKAFFIVLILLVFTTWIPYNKVTMNQIGLLIGTTRFCAFPVLQYMPFYLLGIYMKKYYIGYNNKIMIGAILLTATGIIHMGLNDWKLPGRFPPTAFWIFLPMFFIYVYYLLAKFMEKKQLPSLFLIIMGKNTLLYLLMSNIIIFTFVGKVTVHNIASGLIYTGIILGIITYFIGIIQKHKKAR